MYVEPVMYMYVFDDLNVQSSDCHDIEKCLYARAQMLWRRKVRFNLEPYNVRPVCGYIVQCAQIVYSIL